MRVITPREMAEIDRTAIEVEGISGQDLMERAGAGVANVARDMLSARGGRSVAVFCGKGNNGGDGFVAARLLSDAGFAPAIFLFASANALAGDARANYERLEGMPVSVSELSDSSAVDAFLNASPRFDLVIDALFGTGFSGTASGVFETAILAMNKYSCPVLSVDIPSGVSGATGAVDGAAVRATRTVTFAAPKVGLVQYPGAGMVGELEVIDIGIPRKLLESIPSSHVELVERDDAEALLPRRAADTHKRRCGSVLVIGGSTGMTGAPAMCAQAALRSGSGLVTAAVPSSLNHILEVKLTEVMTLPLPEDPEGSLSAAAAAGVLEIAPRYDVVALGPGMGTRTGTVELVRELVASLPCPLVLDADGLNAMVGATGLFSRRPSPLVLTPHPGEMERLSEVGATGIQSDRVAAALEWARGWNAVVVLKGARTVVAAPSGEARINSTGNPGMATAGMGDVLTGCIASFIAQGLSPFEAAVAGVYFHGCAADLVAEMDGMVGMTAGDVARYLPLALRVS